MVFKWKNNFAMQYLRDHNLKVFRGEEEVLERHEHIYDIKIPNTRYFAGTQFVPVSKETRIIESYEELKDLGFLIVSRKVKPGEKWDVGQAVVYELRKKEFTRDALTGMPKGKSKGVVELDEQNKRIRLICNRAGPLGYGPWVYLEEKPVMKRNVELHYASYSKNADLIMEKLYNKWTGLEDAPEPVLIKEIPFMITDANEIICIPRTPDMPSIMVTGMKGAGKSFTLHSLVSRFFWKYRYKVAILNDSSRETGSWCWPNDEEGQIFTLKKLNERPLPLPVVYLHPTASEDYEKLHMGSVGFDVTLPFKEIITYHRNYLRIEGAVRYFSKFQDALKACKTQKEAEELLDTIEDEYNVPNNTANKIRAELGTLFVNKITDISNEKQSPWRTNKALHKWYNPMTACIHAGLIPVLQTEFVSNNPEMLALYFRYFAGDLFVRQKQDVDFMADQSEIMLVVDEVHNISGAANKNTGADMLLRRCVREGRPRRIGTLLATQKFGELPAVIKDNTTYLLIFKDPGEASAIANQYNMGKLVAEQIKDLEKHHLIAYTTEYFIVYDSNGGMRRSRPNEIFKGKSLPPYSQHKRPLADGGESIKRRVSE